MASVELKQVQKIYPNGFEAVKGIDLEIEDKEFMVLVGPSGCGKTTTLRMIAGLEDVTKGELLINDEVVNEVHPKDRDIAMVFQNYALYPHMNIEKNMSFGLKLQKTPKDEIKQRVDQAAGILGISQLLKNRPRELSGGQRQRVALGRAIVRKPTVFLMDEPLSNLDAKLRVQMRAELIKLHHDLETTFIYVTHDQTEAMTMGTRICVMNEGIIQQVADPRTIYNRPANLFVAGFIGSPPMNFLEGSIEVKGEDVRFSFTHEGQSEKVAISKVFKNNDGREVILGIRPEHVQLVEDGIRSEVVVTELLGSDLNIYFRLQEELLSIKSDAAQPFESGHPIAIQFDPYQMLLFDKTTGERLRDERD
ncbi:MAG: sn-glycerol-3-phosphate ABC transporter ATP-binding protein UgpC [Tissierellia bacterium]|nr:sn-glycerol-3-phosphate ABC transporter ATP-binding protein UgpC [Tissierellia bacterium]